MEISFLAILTNLLLFGQAIINFMEANQSHAEMVKFLWCWIPNCSSEHRDESRDESSHGQHVDSCPQSAAKMQPAGHGPGGDHNLACLGLSIQVAHLYSKALLNSQTCWIASSPQILGPSSQSHQNFQAIRYHAFGLPPPLFRAKMTVF